jgi:glutamine amidotransferase
VTDVVVCDYGAGNLRSLGFALARIGAAPVVSADPDVVAGARVLLVPGQGAAGTAMATLRRLRLARAIHDAVGNGAFLLGVCVGLQLLFAASEEDDVECLGFLPGRVTRLAGVTRLPHMGWNDVAPVGPPHPLARSLPAVGYFAHSYAVADAGPAAVAETSVDGATFASVVASGRVAGAQFHPERSGADGRELLRSFLDWADAA